MGRRGARRSRTGGRGAMGAAAGWHARRVSAGALRRHGGVSGPLCTPPARVRCPERKNEGHSFLLVKGQDGLTTIIAPEQAAKYLGFWLDPQLTFTHHHDKAIIKGSTSLQALRSLAGSTWGASTSAMRRIYQAVVIPQMLYGVSAWYPWHEKGKCKHISSKFAAIQKRAACLIGGAFKTSAAEALNIELHLPPIGIQMDRISRETALRIRTGPAHGIPQLMIRQRSQQQRQRGGWSPMEAHAWMKGGCLTAPPSALARTWESRWAYVQAPWQVPPDVHILERDEAVKKHAEISSQGQGKLIIYTDGSGIEGKIGAAAVVEATREHRHCQMGTEQDSTVYSAELRAVEMALEMVQELQDDRIQQGVVVFSDSQAALQALVRPRMPSGQVYLRGCIQSLQQLNDQGIHVEFRWIPAHQGIPGNELVDQHAKQAAKAEPGPHDRHIKLDAAARRGIRERAEFAWEAAWEKEKVGHATKRLVPVPTKKVLDYWKGQRKASASIMLQMRLNIIGLKRYLWRIGVEDSPRCTCDLGQQQPRHVLLECPLFEDERKDMREALAKAGVDTSLSFNQLMQERSAVPAISAFMERTRLLGQFHNVDQDAMGLEQQEQPV
ncbi:reverse transcriptase [Penicillium longicatenatum]|uniref:reverse transcriptase n=1 Tax=Penicillium longicatenatum TaxID=1561947 RepID=UPI0025479360|nr:reverse transcriptase [Penicillium longicatenatum]KAJ5660660.1 reverse transcriptase [Penicillium longicatenatum]